MFTSFDKALVPAVVAIILAGLSSLGIAETMTVGEVVSYVVASVGVYLVRNKA